MGVFVGAIWVVFSVGLSSPALHELEQIIDCHSVNKQTRGESGCWRSGPPANEPTQVSETLRRFSQHAHSPESAYDIISYLYRPLSIYPCSLESHGTIPSDLRAHSPPLLPFVQVSKTCDSNSGVARVSPKLPNCRKLLQFITWANVHHHEVVPANISSFIVHAKISTTLQPLLAGGPISHTGLIGRLYSSPAHFSTQKILYPA